MLGTILGNSSTNSNLKLRHLSENLKGSSIYHIDKIYLYYLMKHTHTHTHIYIYIGCLNIHGTHVTAYNSTNNYVLFFVSDLKKVYYNNY